VSAKLGCEKVTSIFFKTRLSVKDQVTLNTTVQEAEQLCDERFPEPQAARTAS
jgi:hypothetical protein